MWQGSYGKETFNLRLTILRMVRKLPLIMGITLLGTVLFGGGYYVKNVLLRGEPVYTATSVYRVNYAVEEEKDVGTVYINQVSWNTYLQTEMFLNAVWEELMKSSSAHVVPGDGEGAKLTVQELGAMLTAYLHSDLRVPSTVVTCTNPDMAVWIAEAVESAMTDKIPAEIREITDISVVDSAETAVESVPDVRVGRALILSAVLSCFFAVVLLLIKEIYEDGIWLPASVWKRYGVPVAGYPQCSELAENLAYFFEGKSKVAVCPVTARVNPAEVLQALKESCPEVVGADWFPLPAPEICPETCRELRKAEGILLAVPAGARSSGKTEWTLEYLRQQDCQVTAAILVDADEWLIRNYYRLER